MAKSFAVIGLGDFGMNIARALSRKGFEVLVIDSDETKITQISEEVSQGLVMDATNERALKEAGIQDVDVAIVSVRADEAILITQLLKELGVSRVVVRATSQLQGKILTRIGADRVVFPEREMAERLAQSLSSPKIFDYIELSPEYGVVEIAAPKKLTGKSLKESRLRKNYGVTVMAIRRKYPVMSKKGTPDFKEEAIISPGADDEIQEGDILVLLGKYEDLSKVEKL